MAVLCLRPFRVGVVEYGCGRCMACRVNRRRLWTGRLLMESLLHETSWFVTLTYADEHLPDGGNLDPKELQNFFKRLRDYAYPVKYRYYAVGEYGEMRGRPHYHVALFGHLDAAMVYPVGLQSKLLAAAWKLGHHHIDVLSVGLAGYLCGYMVKGMTKEEDERLCGRGPEFVRMSRKPGIGAGAVVALADALSQPDVKEWWKSAVDVPGVVRIGGRTLPLGRYLKQRLRREFGLVSKCPEEVIADAAGRMVLELSEKGAILQRDEKRVQTDRVLKGRQQIASQRRSL